MNNRRDNTNIINSLIPFGMLSGCALGIIFALFFNLSFLLDAIIIGSGAGFLIGSIAFIIMYEKNND